MVLLNSMAGYPGADFACPGTVQQLAILPLQVGICLLQLGHALLYAASARSGKRYQHLPLQVVALNKGVDHPRRHAPPNGVAYVNHLNAGKVCLSVFQGRTRLCIIHLARAARASCANCGRASQGRRTYKAGQA